MVIFNRLVVLGHIDGTWFQWTFFSLYCTFFSSINLFVSMNFSLLSARSFWLILFLLLHLFISSHLGFSIQTFLIKWKVFSQFNMKTFFVFGVNNSHVTPLSNQGKWVLLNLTGMHARQVNNGPRPPTDINRPKSSFLIRVFDEKRNMEVYVEKRGLSF